MSDGGFVSKVSNLLVGDEEETFYESHAFRTDHILESEQTLSQRIYRKTKRILKTPLFVILFSLAVTILSGFGWIGTLVSTIVLDSDEKTMSNYSLLYVLLILWLLVYLQLCYAVVTRTLPNWKDFVLIFLVQSNVLLVTQFNKYSTLDAQDFTNDSKYTLNVGLILLITVNYVFIILVSVGQQTLLGRVLYRPGQSIEVRAMALDKWRFCRSLFKNRDNEDEEEEDIEMDEYIIESNNSRCSSSRSGSDSGIEGSRSRYDDGYDKDMYSSDSQSSTDDDSYASSSEEE